MTLQYLDGADPPRGLVRPLVDGFAYYDDFFAEIETLTAGDRVYIMNWYMDPAFYRQATLGQTREQAGDAGLLAFKLLGLHHAGVDVRVLVWMNTNFFRPAYPPVLQRQLVNTIPFHPQQLATAATVHHWRALGRAAVGPGQPSLADRIVVNTLDAPTGGCHAKFALVLRQQGAGYEGIGYTGGLDFGAGRYGAPRHEGDGDGWHDVQARVEGPEIVSDLADFYVQMWNENVARLGDDLAAGRRSTIRIAPDLLGEGQPEYTFPCVPDGAGPIDRAAIDLVSSTSTWPHRVQSLRTVPNIIPWPILGEREISWAPDGVFEFRDALQHAIGQAQHYVYIEDQAMESLEIFDWLLDALQDNDELHVVCVTGARDPADPPTKHIDRTLLAWWFHNRLDDGQRRRFHYFGVNDYVVHSKVFLIDDVVAFVGSAGMFTRSLTHELEHAVAFVADDADSEVRNLRVKLWAELFDVEPEQFELAFPTIGDALDGFDPSEVDETDPLTLPCHAVVAEQSTNFGFDVLMPVIVDGVLQEGTLSSDEIDDVLESVGVKPAEVTVVSHHGFETRALNWTPVRAAVVVYTRPVEVTDDDGTTRTVQRKQVAGPVPRASDAAFPSPDPEVTASSITDERLFTSVFAFYDPDAPPVTFVQDFAEAGLMIECTGGSNTGEVRPILTHVGTTITFEPFTDPPDGEFDYQLLRPYVAPIDLGEYASAPAYEDDASSLVADAAVHLLTHEIPFISLFNPTQITRRSIPMPITSRVGINEIVTFMILAAPTETITWECNELDAQPTSGTDSTFAIQFTNPGPKVVRGLHVLPDGPPITYEYRLWVMENSGADWVALFQPSRSLDDLAEPFRTRVTAFLAALTQAGVPYEILTTRRPKQRAYLMAWAYRIARQDLDPIEVESRLDDVPINWVHRGADGEPDPAASKAAAEEMVVAYDIGSTGASEKSRHIGGTAIDVRIDIANPREVAMKNGTTLLVDSEERLTRVGESYRIRRLRESNHWSLSGH
ncbi:MAG: phospholipase D-like domain-containing protein [Ilumatobacter sp.]|uniref:phospholipase D-like domain-containing protein n=1 Tax=Ilumatobacter sp. TaxID=1967498 RepID=UPI0026073EB1|nr:phospholipase D-like domain-containing protein [Ilumatobacter sp.]MDJ0770678.1 phospholipase D-like domain-containing protein [Ilumatobacter sp.]